MEGVVEDDDGLSSGERAGDLDGVLVCLGARVDKEAALWLAARDKGVETLGESDVGLKASDLETGVGEALDLLSHRLDDLRGARADVQHGDASAQVYERVAVHVDDDAARGPLGEDGIVAPTPAGSAAFLRAVSSNDPGPGMAVLIARD